MHWGGCQQGSPSGRALDGRAATRRRPLPNRARRAVPDYRNAVIESGSGAQPAASQRTSEYAKSDSCPRASTAATEIQNAPPQRRRGLVPRDAEATPVEVPHRWARGDDVVVDVAELRRAPAHGDGGVGAGRGEGLRRARRRREARRGRGDELGDPRGVLAGNELDAVEGRVLVRGVEVLARGRNARRRRARQGRGAAA